MSAPGSHGFTAELPAQDDPAIGRELIRVTFDDGRVEELALHDYERVYALPGVYEQIVTERLGCRSPWEIAGMLAAAADRLGRPRRRARARRRRRQRRLPGEALAAAGLVPVIGTDIVPIAREAALRDRPGLYAQYLTLDLLALSADQAEAVSALGLDALSCVAPVGEAAQQLPPAALAAAAALLSPDALVAYMHDPGFSVPDPVTAEFWVAALGPGTRAEELERRRYLHRRTVNGRPYEMVGVVWRLRRG